MPRRRSWLIAIAAVLLIAAVLFAPLPLPAAAGETRYVSVEARMFAFEPAVIRVNRGDVVTLDLEALDATHGLYLDGYGVNLRAEPGHRAQATFVADRAGKFKFRCSYVCGNLHPFMIGELYVGPNLPFVRAIAAMLIATVGALALFWRKPNGHHAN